MRKARQPSVRNNSASARAASSGAPGWHIPVILAAGILAYANSFRGVFLLDDFGHIVTSETIKSIGPLSVHLADFRPMVHFSLALNYALSGLEVWSYHALNLAIHLAAATILYLLLRQTPRCSAGDAASTAQSSKPLLSHGLAFAVALLWVIHPIQTQAVTYIIQRGESLMGLWYLLTLYCVLCAHRLGRTRLWGVLAVLCCAAGMLTKETMVTAPFAALMYDAVFLSGSWRRALRRHWPIYAGLCATWGILAYLGLFHDILYGSKKHGVDMGFKVETMTPWTYLLTQPEVILHYLRLCFWPYPQCFDYGWQPVKSWTEAVLPGLAVIGLLATTIWSLIKRPRIGFLAAWVFIILSPTSSFIPIKDFAFEHRMYLPLATILIACTLGLQAIASKWDWARRPRVGMVALAVVALVLVGRTIRRNADYSSASLMWSDVVSQRPTHARAWNYYGVSLAVEDRHAEAIHAYERALQLKPESDDVHINFGKSLSKVGRYDEAVAHFREALKLSADDAMLHHSLAIALEKSGRLEEALREYAETIRLDPAHPFARFNRGLALKSAGRWSEAETAFADAARVPGSEEESICQRAFCLIQLGKRGEAAVLLKDLLRARPGYPAAVDLLNRLEAKS